jgi:hypothetical protein
MLRKEGTSTVRCLLAVEVYELSENYIFELKEGRKKPNSIGDILPEYTINTNEGQHNQPMNADYFLQFVGLDYVKNPKNCLLFNLRTFDSILQEEISNVGIEDLFNDYDFKKLLSVFKPHTDDDMKRYSMPYTYYMVVDVVFETTQDYYSGGWECESSVNIVGYLDDKMQITEYKYEQLICNL